MSDGPSISWMLRIGRRGRVTKLDCWFEVLVQQSWSGLGTYQIDSGACRSHPEQMSTSVPPQRRNGMTSISASSRRLVVLCAALVVAAGWSCKSTPTPPTDVASSPLAPITSMQVVPAVASMRLGDSMIFSLAIELGEGVPPSGPVPTWSSTSPTVIAVDASGRATALGLGDAAIEVAAHGRRAARRLRVVQ
jgi:hypothetical protein